MHNAASARAHEKAYAPSDGTRLQYICSWELQHVPGFCSRAVACSPRHFCQARGDTMATWQHQVLHETPKTMMQRPHAAINKYIATTDVPENSSVQVGWWCLQVEVHHLTLGTSTDEPMRLHKFDEYSPQNNIQGGVPCATNEQWLVAALAMKSVHGLQMAKTIVYRRC